MGKRWLIAFVALLAGVALSGTGTASASTPISADVRVDADCGGVDCGTMSLASSNTTRKLAVTSNGTIYALFYGGSGIWVSKSVDRGATFQSGVQVSADTSEPEIAASAGGQLYVIWNDGTGSVVSKSNDSGATWSTPVATGISSGPAHLAVDGDYIYAVDKPGSTLAYSHDAGSTWNTTSTGSSYVFADVRVDRATRDVYVLVDNPSVFWYKSTDFGVTLSSANSTGKSVFYSVGALSSDGTNLNFYMAGSGANLEVIDLLNGTATTQTVTASSDSQGRSLFADNCGNVVTGYKNGADLAFQYSIDSGATFSSPITVISGATRANASINETNGDVMFLYESNGDIFLTTYSGLLSTDCYKVQLSLTAVDFTSISQNPTITLTNTSANPVTVSASVSGTGFSVSDNCGGTLAANSTCTITVSSDGTGTSGDLTVTLDGTSRLVPLTVSTQSAPPPATTTPPTTTAPPSSGGSPSPAPAPAPTPVYWAELDPAGGVCDHQGTGHSDAWTFPFVGSHYIPGADECEREGFTFKYWAHASDPTVSASLPLLLDMTSNKWRHFIASNVTLVAVWEANAPETTVPDITVPETVPPVDIPVQLPVTGSDTGLNIAVTVMLAGAVLLYVFPRRKGE